MSFGEDLAIIYNKKQIGFSGNFSYKQSWGIGILGNLVFFNILYLHSIGNLFARRLNLGLCWKFVL